MIRSFLIILGIIFTSFSSPLLAMEGHEDSSAEIEASTSEEADENSIAYRVTKYAGKFHLLVIHFPIAFLLVAAHLQWFFFFTGKGGQLVPGMLWIGAIGSVLAAALGWAYAYDSVYFGESEGLLFWHRWLGTSTAIVASLVLIFRNKLGVKGLSIALTLAAALVGVAAHFGGSLVYGNDFFFEF